MSNKKKDNRSLTPVRNKDKADDAKSANNENEDEIMNRLMTEVLKEMIMGEDADGKNDDLSSHKSLDSLEIDEVEANKLFST